MLARALLLLLVAVVAHAPQWSGDEWRGTEARRVQIAHEMAQSGDLLVPTLGHERTLAKPPLHYWLLAALERAFGLHPAIMRLPALLGWWLLAVWLFSIHRRRFSPGAGWMAALATLLSPVLLAEGVSAEIDPLFSVLVAASIVALAEGIAFARAGMVAVAGVLGGVALLQKGPPYLLFVAGTMLVWWRHRRLRLLPWYVIPLLLVPAPYYVLLLQRIPWAEFAAVAQEESVGRTAYFTWQSVYGAPAYWLRALALLLPVGLFAVWEYRGSRDARMGAQDLMLRCCSSSAIVAIALFTFFPSRPTRYLLPIVPVFLAAVAPAFAHFAQVHRRLGPPSRRALQAAGLLGALLLLAAPWLPAPFPRHALGFGAVLAVLPALVTTPRRMAIAALAVPMFAALTLLAARTAAPALDTRARAPLGPILQHELTRLQATDVATFGHFHSALVLGLARIPDGDELCRQPATAHHVMCERRNGSGPDLSGHRDRVLLCAHDRTFVIAERKGP